MLPPDDLVVMGHVAAPFGVQGWIRVHTYTQQADRLADYDDWWMGREGQWRAAALKDAEFHAKGMVARIEGVNDRDAALALKGQLIAVSRSSFPETAEGEYYWNDLIGLEVVNTADVPLGRVTGLMETGANDVLRIELDGHERLIPFVRQFVLNVDPQARQIRVDWELDY